MATILVKDVTRESELECNGRKIVVTLTKDQRVSMKLKGMKSGIVSIGLDELYAQLTGEPCIDGDPEEKNKGSITISNEQPKIGKTNPMLSLHDLRSQSIISNLDYDVKVKFEGIINNLIQAMKWEKSE